MDSPTFLTKSITVRGVDGNDIRVSETAERNEVVVVIQQNDESARVATVRLSHPQFNALCESKYSLELKTDSEDQPNAQI